MAFQEPASALDPARRCYDQLDEALRKTTATAVERRRVISRGLERVGLNATDRVLRAFPRVALSGGERQRVLLALATLQDPAILIADEPTTALDPVLRLEFATLLARLREQNHLSAVVITHDIDLVHRIADRVLTLDHGHLVEARAERQPAPRKAAPRPQHDGNPVLRVANLGKSYDRGSRRFVALAGISFDLFEGEALGVIGASGSGKTTLARLIAGLEPVEAGEIEMHRIAGYRGPAMVQMIFQDSSTSLDPLMTAGRSIAETLSGDISATDTRAEIANLLATVGLSPDIANRKPRELSGGERQRVAIARALGPPTSSHRSR